MTTVLISSCQFPNRAMHFTQLAGFAVVACGASGPRAFDFGARRMARADFFRGPTNAACHSAFLRLWLSEVHSPIKFFHDGGHGRGPDARFRIGIPRGQKLLNGLFQIVHTDEDAPPNPFPGQFAKPAFDQIQPTGTGRNKMRDEAGVSPQPALHAGMFVRAVVVPHDMQLQIGWKRLVQPPEKFQELLMAMPRLAFSDHLAGGQCQRGQECGRPLALVVVRHRSAATALERQARRRALQGLDLALFIETEHQRLGGRIQIQPPTSVSLARKCGSRESLKLPVRCGLS